MITKKGFDNLCKHSYIDLECRWINKMEVIIHPLILRPSKCNRLDSAFQVFMP